MTRIPDSYHVRFVVLATLIAAAAISRLLPHPPNFSPIGAIPLFGGACFADRRAAFAVPLAAMLFSDLGLAWQSGSFAWAFDALMTPVIYACVALAVVLGTLLRARRRPAPVLGMTLASALTFFMVTNFAVWAHGALYPRTWDGLIACYVAAIPFFRNALLGDLSYAAALFGALALAERAVPALRERPLAGPGGLRPA